jgi:hypothetical protein
VQITKNNFTIAKAVKSFVEEGSPRYALHITNEFTEIACGAFVVRVRHSDQHSFEFELDNPVSVCLNPEDALNIASSLGKDDYIKAVIPSDDQKTVQIEFSSGEIRILPMLQETFPDVPAIYPKNDCGFSVAVDPEFMIATLRAFSSMDMRSVLLEFRGSEKVIVISPPNSADERAQCRVSALVMPQGVAGVVDLPTAKKGKRSTAASDSDNDSPMQSVLQ